MEVCGLLRLGNLNLVAGSKSLCWSMKSASRKGLGDLGIGDFRRPWICPLGMSGRQPKLTMRMLASQQLTNLCNSSTTLNSPSCSQDWWEEIVSRLWGVKLHLSLLDWSQQMLRLLMQTRRVCRRSDSVSERFLATRNWSNQWIQEDDKPFEVRLSDESFETYELDPPPYTLDTTKKELKQMYYDMVAVRYEAVSPF